MINSRKDNSESFLSGNSSQRLEALKFLGGQEDPALKSPSISNGEFFEFSGSDDDVANRAVRWVQHCFLAATGPSPLPEATHSRKGESEACFFGNNSQRLEVSKFCGRLEDGPSCNPTLKSPSISNCEVPEFSNSNDDRADGAGHWIQHCFLAAAGPSPSPAVTDSRKGESEVCLSGNGSARLEVSKFCGG